MQRQLSDNKNIQKIVCKNKIIERLRFGKEIANHKIEGIKKLPSSIYKLIHTKAGFNRKREAIMNTKGKIKVIKKGTQTKVVKRVEKNSTKETARQMVSNVTNWVTDFQQRRREETKQAIEQLFAQQPQPSGI